LAERNQEGFMRLFLTVATVTAALLGTPGFAPVHPAHAADCTGENCPPPGGHDCEHEKKQQTTS
jgi:hypothetical protein